MFDKKSKLEELAAIHSETLLVQGAAIIRLQESTQQAISAILSRIIEYEDAVSKTLNVLNDQLKILTDRIQLFEETLLNEGKIVKLPNSLKKEDKN